MSAALAGAGPLHERERPQSWDEVIGQDKAVKVLRALERRPGGLSGRAYFITGASGTGKSTIARLIAASVADEWSTQEIDAGEATPTRLKDLERESSITGLGVKSGRAFIVNEAHGLRKEAIRQLLVMLERIPSHAVWIFTTTIEGRDGLFEDCADASPLLSRCVPIELARRNLAEVFAQRARDVAEREGMGGKPAASYLRLVQDNRNNLRAVYSAIEAGAMLAD